MDYRSYNPFTSQFISEGGEKVVLRGISRRVPSSHAVGCVYSEIDEDFVRSNGGLARLRASLNGWVDASDSIVD